MLADESTLKLEPRKTEVVGKSRAVMCYKSSEPPFSRLKAEHSDLGGGFDIEESLPLSLIRNCVHSIAMMWDERQFAAQRNAIPKVLPVELLDLLLRELLKCGKDIDGSVTCFFSPHRSRLDFSSATRLRKSRLMGIPQGCPRLVSLNLSNCIQVNNTIVRNILQNCAELEALSLDGCHVITDAAFKPEESAFYPLRAYLSLKEINVSMCAQLTDYFAMLMAKNCQSLESVSIAMCRSMSGGSVQTLLSAFPAIRRLNASFVTGVTDDHLVFQEGGLSALEYLNLSRSDITKAGLAKIGSCAPKLRVLKLNSCIKLSDEAIGALVSEGGSGMHNLVDIRLSNCGKLTDKSLCLLAEACPKLEAIDVSWCQSMTDAGLVRGLKKWPALRSIALVWCPLLTDASLFAMAARCKALREVSLGFLSTSVFSPAGLEEIQRAGIHLS